MAIVNESIDIKQRTPDVFVGLDLGTTAVKACAFRLGGQLIAETRGEYPLNHPETGAAVQDVEQIARVTEKVLVELIGQLPEPPAGLSLSCPMHGLLLLDEHHRPLGPVITWADVRAQAVMDEFSPELRARLLRLTGTPVHPMSPLVKLRWLARHRPDWIEEATFVADLKSYLVDRWTTAGLLLDEQLASATGLLDLESRRWSEEALRIAAADRLFTRRLPRVRPATTRLEWRPEVAARLGVTDLPLFLGGSDGCLANLGSGLLEPGKVSLTIGTSGAVRVTHRGTGSGGGSEHPLFNYILLDNYAVLGGATNNGGKVMEWTYELLCGHFEDIGAMIEAAAAHETDLAFTPYLLGERAPIWDALATAAFTGVRGSHGALDFARAALIGVTDNIITILRQVEAATGPAKVIYASGGFTRSAGWVELLAERSGRRVEIAHTPQASAFGAALIAAIAVGDYCLPDGGEQTARPGSGQ